MGGGKYMFLIIFWYCKFISSITVYWVPSLIFPFWFLWVLLCVGVCTRSREEGSWVLLWTWYVASLSLLSLFLLFYINISTTNCRYLFICGNCRSNNSYKMLLTQTVYVRCSQDGELGCDRFIIPTPVHSYDTQTHCTGGSSFGSFPPFVSWGNVLDVLSVLGCYVFSQ